MCYGQIDALVCTAAGIGIQGACSKADLAVSDSNPLSDRAWHNMTLSAVTSLLHADICLPDRSLFWLTVWPHHFHDVRVAPLNGLETRSWL